MKLTYEELQELVDKKRFVFFGEVHGTKEIPKKVEQLLSKTRSGIFCAEFIVQALPKVKEFLRDEITQEQILNEKWLKEAVHDRRVTPSILSLWKELFNNNTCVEALEDYNAPFTCAADRDRMMAQRFTSFVNRNPEKRCFIYVGGMHLLDEELTLGQFTVTPLKTFLPKKIREQALTIQFEQGEKNITYDESKNVVIYT